MIYPFILSTRRSSIFILLNQGHFDSYSILNNKELQFFIRQSPIRSSSVTIIKKIVPNSISSTQISFIEKKRCAAALVQIGCWKIHENQKRDGFRILLNFSRSDRISFLFNQFNQSLSPFRRGQHLKVLSRVEYNLLYRDDVPHKPNGCVQAPSNRWSLQVLNTINSRKGYRPTTRTKAGGLQRGKDVLPNIRFQFHDHQIIAGQQQYLRQGSVHTFPLNPSKPP